jgi:hypothetical protein
LQFSKAQPDVKVSDDDSDNSSSESEEEVAPVAKKQRRSRDSGGGGEEEAEVAAGLTEEEAVGLMSREELQEAVGDEIQLRGITKTAAADEANLGM